MALVSWNNLTSLDSPSTHLTQRDKVFLKRFNYLERRVYDDWKKLMTYDYKDAKTLYEL
jgi:hypothetical protein